MFQNALQQARDAAQQFLSRGTVGLSGTNLGNSQTPPIQQPQTTQPLQNFIQGAQNTIQNFIKQGTVGLSGTNLGQQFQNFGTSPLGQVPLFSSEGAFSPNTQAPPIRLAQFFQPRQYLPGQPVSKFAGNTLDQIMESLPFVAPLEGAAAKGYNLTKGLIGAGVAGAIPAVSSTLKGEKIDPLESLRSAPWGLLAGFVPSMEEGTPPLSPTEESLSSQAQKTPPLSFEEEMNSFNKNFTQQVEDMSRRTEVAKTTAPEIQTSHEAIGRGSILGGLAGPINQETKQAFADWVNARAASKVQGLLKQREFADLNNRGIQGIFDFQAGDKTGRLADVKDYFDKAYQLAQDKGIKFNYKADYLPQLWQNTPDQVAQVFGRNLSWRPSFTMESLIKDYQTGMSKGLTPKFQNIGELAGWYEQRLNKALADKSFFDYLAKEDIIKPQGQADIGWKTLDPDRFPKLSVRTGEGLYRGVYSGPAPVADLINNYLNAPEGTLQGLANIFSLGKRLVMSTGIPETGLNPHGLNIAVRGSLNPAVGPLKTLSRLIFPPLASRSIEENLESAPFAVKSGLNLRLENATFQKPIEDTGTFSGIAGKYVGMFSNHFEKPLFGKIIPSLMLDGFNNEYKMLVKTGMDAGEAAKTAATHQNTIFGNINWEAMGRSPEATTIFRLLAFAPQWLESNLRLGAGIAKSFVNPANPAGMLYRRMGLGMLGTYTAANVLNYKTSGHFMYQNAPGHTFEIEAGYTPDGQKRYIKPFGTALDFVRLPMDVALAAYKAYRQGGDVAKESTTAITRIIQNRLTTPVSILAQLTSGIDAMGHQATTLASKAGILSTAIFPGSVKGGIDYFSGNKRAEQSIAEAVGLPIRYSGGPATKKIAAPLVAQGVPQQIIDTAINKMYQYAQDRQKVIQQGGLTNKEQTAYDYIHSSKTKDVQGNPIDVNNVYTSPSNYGVYLANPRLIDIEKSMASQQPTHDPLWDLSTKQIRAYMQAQVIAKNNPTRGFQTGDKTVSTLYSTIPQSFFQQRQNYFNNLQSQGINLGSSNLPQSPQTPPDVQQFWSNYSKLPYGTGARTQALQTPLGQKALAFTQQEQQFTNSQRADMDLPLMNPTSSSNTTTASTGGGRGRGISYSQQRYLRNKLLRPIAKNKTRIPKSKLGKINLRSNGFNTNKYYKLKSSKQTNYKIPKLKKYKI